MPHSLNLQDPLLINTVGHAAGAIVFAIFLYLFFRDARGARLGRSALPALAAALALLWNLGSLLVLSGAAGEAVAVAFSFSVLSLLPAILLSISLQGRWPALPYAGFVLSGIAILLHVSELIVHDPRLHQLGLLLISFGFGALTAISVAAGSRRSGRMDRGAKQRILAAMALFLFATSFVHFGDSHTQHPWSQEIALHHAGIPLALFVLLQDYRFLLLDAFLRFLANAVLAVVLTIAALVASERLHLLQRTSGNAFLQGLLIVGAGVGLIAFSQLRTGVQRWLTRFVFRRPVLSSTLQRLVAESVNAEPESELLERSLRLVADYAVAERRGLRRVERDGSASPDAEMLFPQPVTNPAQWNLSSGDEWVEAIVPLRFSRGDRVHLLLGRRTGGRPYLSEDLQNLAQLALAIVSQVERFRSGEIERLASRAELRALQAQINPHFLFNALNALYGTIPRQVESARRTVLNLAEIFRYFLRTDKMYIALSEEMRIVRAYLEIEQLRLGERLETELDVSPGTLSIQIPTLSIQPLIENAVKHGVAAKSGPGRVQLTIRTTGRGLHIRVEDTGEGEPTGASSNGAGVGLENVRQRLKLCYGERSAFQIHSSRSGTAVEFYVPEAEAK